MLWTPLAQDSVLLPLVTNAQPANYSKIITSNKTNKTNKQTNKTNKQTKQTNKQTNKHSFFDGKITCLHIRNTWQQDGVLPQTCNPL
ncbi:hypothetical protein BH11BAC5_BH11BAC5_33310 [soil metagenome]